MLISFRTGLFVIAFVVTTPVINAYQPSIDVVLHEIDVSFAVPGWDLDLKSHSNSDLRNQFDTLKSMATALSIEHKERLLLVFAELRDRNLVTDTDKESLISICLSYPVIPSTSTYIAPSERIALTAKQTEQYVRDTAAGKRPDIPVIDTDSGVVIGFFSADLAENTFSAQPGDVLPVKRSFRGSKFDLTSSKRIYAIDLSATPQSTIGARITPHDPGLQPIVENGHLTSNKEFRWTITVSPGFDGGKFSLSATLFRFDNSDAFHRCKQHGDCAVAFKDGIVIPGETITIIRKHPLLESGKRVVSVLKSLFGWIGGIPAVILAWQKLRDRWRLAREQAGSRTINNEPSASPSEQPRTKRHPQGHRHGQSAS